MQESVLRDCISMCFDICTINIRVSIRVRGLHLVFIVGTVSKVEDSTKLLVNFHLFCGSFVEVLWTVEVTLKKWKFPLFYP